MNVRNCVSIAFCILFISHLAAAQEAPESQRNNGRVYVLLLSGNDAATLKPISGIEEIPPGGSCLSFREISCVRENGQVHLFAVDARRHFHGRTMQADRIELLLGENGIEFNGDWQMTPLDAEESVLYRMHYARHSAATKDDIAERWILRDQRQIFRGQLMRSSNALLPHER